MHLSEKILLLRKQQGLSQEALAEQLGVSRQAVSRWENGDTTPGTDTLKLIAQTFGVTVDYLLGRPAGQCQSCGMILETDSDRGTKSDGSRSEEYCAFCYQQGKFVHDIAMEEMIEHNLKDLDQWSESVGLNLSEQEARAQLMEFLPTLRRWRRS